MKKIWVLRYNDGSADVWDEEKGPPSWPYIDAFDVEDALKELHSDYTALLARHNALEEALREIRDYDAYKHPDESVIAERTKAILDSESCSECQHIKKAGWPQSGLCNTHYRTVMRAQNKVTQMFEYKQTWEPREIARRALEEK